MISLGREFKMVATSYKLQVTSYKLQVETFRADSMIKQLFLVMAILSFLGCSSSTDSRYATHETVLVNLRGEVKYCYYVNDTYEDSSNINGNYNKCLNEAGLLGYKKVR